MAKVNVQVAGGGIQQKEAATIGCLAKLVDATSGYTATVNGEPQGNDYELQDYEFVSFAKAAKAGIRKALANGVTIIVRKKLE